MMQTMTQSIVPTTSTTVAHRAASLDELQAAWLASLMSPNTRDAYRRDLTAYRAWLDAEGLEVDRAQPRDLDAYRDTLDKAGRAPSTIARHLAALSSFYRYAAREAAAAGTFYRSPLGDGLVKRPKVSPSSNVLGLTADETRLMLTAAKASTRDYALLHLMVANGLRVSEVVGLRLENLDEVRGRTQVTITGKGGNVSTVVLAPSTTEAVKALAGDRTEGYLFATRTGRAMSREHAGRIVKRVAAAAGLDPAKVHPHAFRHTFVTVSLEAGVPLHRVQRDARHADPRTTQRYNDAREALTNPTSDVVAALVG